MQPAIKKKKSCLFCWCLGLFGCGVVVCFVVFLFPAKQVSWNFLNPPRVLDLDDRQGLISSSALQCKKKKCSRQISAKATGGYAALGVFKDDRSD